MLTEQGPSESFDCVFEIGLAKARRIYGQCNASPILKRLLENSGGGAPSLAESGHVAGPNGTRPSVIFRSSWSAGCSFGRREEPNPGTRPHPAGIADENQALGTMTYDYETSRHHYAVPSSQHPRWHRHRPQHAEPSPPRVHPPPQYDRGAGPKGAPMAGAAYPLDVRLPPTSAS